MSPSLGFDFHALVGFELQTEDPEAIRFFQAEYGEFLAHGTRPSPLVRLDWARRRRAGDPPLRPHAHKVLARWAYRVDLHERSVDLVVRGNRWAIPMVHHMLVHPALRYLASAARTMLLHASSVARHGRSLIFTGEGGAGKTTTAALLLASDSGAWQVHADDYVWLGDDGITRAYPTRSHLYWNQLSWVPELRSRLTTGERARLPWLWALRRGSGERLKWPVRVEHSRLWPGRPTAAQAQGAAILLLRRGEGPGPVLNPIAPTKFPVDDLIRMNFAEARHFLRLLEDGPGRRPAGWRQAWVDREVGILREAVGTLPGYHLEIPRRPTDRRADRDHLTRLFEGLVPSPSRSDG